jgi:SAM-dependent methyltransferase
VTTASQPHSQEAPPQPFQMPDWSVGRYESFARELEPAAEHVVELAALRPGERVLDLGCGTGNAALLAARAGALVTGLDPARRLLQVARDRLAADQLDGTFVVGDAQSLPFEDDAFDVVLSVFGVIFAPDARTAVSELLRVLSADGRALISAWTPGGAVDAMTGVIIGAIGAALGTEIPRFPWHDLTAVRGLAATLGATINVREGEIAFTADSPESYLADQEGHHPLTIAGRNLLAHAGSYEHTRARMLDALTEGNEDTKRFRATSGYRVIELRRPR